MKCNYYKSFLFPLTLTGTFASPCHAVPEWIEVTEDYFPHGTLLRIPVGFSQGTFHHSEIDLNASIADIHRKISDKRQSVGLSQKIPLTEQENILTLFPWAKASLEHEKCPMLGQIIHMFVKEGDRVERGDPLFIVTALKMESTIRASASGRIHKIFAQEGEFVEADSNILCTLPLLADWDNLDPGFLDRNRHLFESLFPWAPTVEPQTHLTHFQNVNSQISILNHAPKAAPQTHFTSFKNVGSLNSVLESTPEASVIPLEDTPPPPQVEENTPHVEESPTPFTHWVTFEDKVPNMTSPGQFKAPVNNPVQSQKSSEVFERAEIHFHATSYDFPCSTQIIPTQLPSISSPLKVEEDYNPTRTKTKTLSKFFMAERVNSQRGYLSLYLAALAALFMSVFKRKRTESPQPTHNVIRADFSPKRPKNTPPSDYRKAA